VSLAVSSPTLLHLPVYRCVSATCQFSELDTSSRLQLEMMQQQMKTALAQQSGAPLPLCERASMNR